MQTLLIQIITLAFAAVVFVPLFRKIGLGAILAYLFAGVVIGPSVLSFIQESQDILHFSELGVVFLLFVIGLELAPHKLWELRNSIFGLGFLQVALTGFFFTFLGLLVFDLSMATAYVCGFGLALSSTAFSIQILEDNNQIKTTHGQGTFAILMFQDIAVVPILASLALFNTSSETTLTFWAFFKVIVLLVLLAFFANFLIRHILRMVADTETPEVFTALSLLIVIGSALLLESVGLSLGMGAFLAGVLLANSEYRHELETNLLPFKGLLLGLFFMAVGMSLDLRVLVEKPHWILLITLGFMTIKAFVIYGLGLLFKYPKESSRNMAVNLSLGGEFAFVIFSTAITQNLLDAELSSILSASVTISMALTPFIFTLNQRYLRKFSEISERPYDQIDSSDVEVIVAGFGRFGQIVTRFLNAEKVNYTILDHSAGQVDTARRFGNKVYYGDASRHDILEAAGAKKAKYFVLAIDDHEQSVPTAKVVKQHFPHLDIIARVRNRQHALDLMEIGIPAVYRETYLTSLEVARQIMLRRGKKPENVKAAIEKFISHDEKILLKQLELRHDEKQFINYTLQANKELEQILTQDQEIENNP